MDPSNPPVFSRMVYEHVEEICWSAVFRARPLLQKLLKFIVLQTIYLRRTTEPVLLEFLRANSDQKKNNLSDNFVRQNVSNLRKLLDQYYKSYDSASAIIVISIPPAGIDPHTRKRLHYEAVASFHEAINRNARTFGAALHFKYGIPKDDGEAWFITGSQPPSVFHHVLKTAVSRALLTHLLGKRHPPDGSLENPFDTQVYTEAGASEYPPAAASTAGPFQPDYHVAEKTWWDRLRIEDVLNEDFVAKAGQALRQQVAEVLRTIKDRTNAVEIITSVLHQMVEHAESKVALSFRTIHDMEVAGNRTQAYLTSNFYQYEAIPALQAITKTVRLVLALMNTEDFANVADESLAETLDGMVSTFFCLQ